MKKGLLIASLLLLGAGGAGAQAVVDTVSVGATASGISYPNQVWYSLPNDEQGSRPRNEWDIAFDLKNITSGVITNSPGGVMLWKYPKANLSAGWGHVDTAGLSTWTPHYNSDTSWALGAIGRYADPNDGFDLDWGTYDLNTHQVLGDSMYIVKLVDGQYKQFAVVSLISGVYTFKYADLDGSNTQTQTIAKTAYAGKNFAYFNLSSNTALDREPASASWDLLFTQYTAFVPIAYTVTGVLLNQTDEAVKVSGLPDVATNTGYSGRTFSTQINTIGYDWKTFTGTAYTVKDSQLYFVMRANGDIWKLIFKGFGGSANGNFIFSKERIYTAPTGIGRVAAQDATVALYPNPATGGTVHVLYDFKSVAAGARLAVYDLAGRMVHTAMLEESAGLHQYALPTAGLNAGVYLVTVTSARGSVQQKLMVR